MKRYYYIILLTSLLFAACGNRHSADKQNAATENHEGHNHATEGHNHAAEAPHGHEGHNHSAEEHNHAAEGHNHAAEEPHGHEGHNHAEEVAAEDADEIVFSPERAERAGVKCTRIEAAPFAAVIKTFGEITPASGDAAVVSSPAAGIISFAVQPVVGTKVGKGETIAVVSSSAIADGDPVVKAKIAYESARKEYERAKKLVGKQIVSQKEFEAAEERYLTAEAAYRGVATTQNGAEGTVVKAPSDGYIDSVSAAEGQYVGVGQAVVGISKGNRMLLCADVPQNLAGKLSKVVSASFRLPSDKTVYSTEHLGGRLISVGRSVQVGSFYVPVTFSFENRGGLVGGQIVEVWLQSAAERNAVAVPKSALTEEQGLYFVYIRLDEECYRKVAVRLGDENGDMIEITSGLRGGEEVVTEGAYHVKLASVKAAIPGHTHNH